MIISPMNVTLIDSMGSDVSVVNAARVSFDKFHEVFEEGKDDKLIAYLAKHNHFTPFCHAFLSFRIKAPIFVARQLVKHQVGLSWNEVSRRYVDTEPEFWFPEVWRKRAENVKQGSSETESVNLAEVLDNDVEYGDYFPHDITRMANDCYRTMLRHGVAPEQARMVLPQNTMTEWIWSGSLMAFARVVKLRLDPHAQKETAEIANLINVQVPTEFDHSWQALVAN